MTQSSASASKRDQRPWILAALMFTIMLAAMDATIVSTAIPQIAGDLGGFSLFSWVFSIYLLAQTVTIPLYGKLADLYGRKPILIYGMVVFLIGSAACSLSWDMIALIFFRAIQGIGAGAIMATVNTIAGDIYTIEERAKIQGWLSSVWGMAAIAGPSLGGFFAEYSTWRWIFLINLPIGILALILIVIFFKEKVVRRPHHLDISGAIMMLITGSVMMYTLIEGGSKWEWISTRGVSMVMLSIILISITVMIEVRSKEPIMSIWVWRNKTMLGANLAMIGMGAVLLGPNMYLPVFSQAVKGLGAIAAGFILSSSSIGWPVASSLSGRLYLKIGFRNTAMIGAMGIVILSFSFTLLTFDSSPWFLVVQQVLLGASFGLLSTPSLVGVQSIVPWEKRGVVTGANMFSRFLGQSMGAAILGGVFNSKMNAILSQAPTELNAEIPLVNDVIDVLQSGESSVEIANFLQQAFYDSTHQVYFVMMCIGIFTFLVLFLQPKKFPVLENKER